MSVPLKTSPLPERLIVVTGQHPEPFLKNLRDRYEVTQSISKRVFLVRADQSERGAPNPEFVHVFHSADIPEEVLKSLDGQELLFVKAWLTRLQQQPKRRVGDGVNWDDPRFKAP